MSTCVIVLGPPRSGTSAVAGLLHRLGVPMGTRFPAADDWNAPGYFADSDFADAFTAMGLDEAHKGMSFWGNDPIPAALSDLITARGKASHLWGFKHHAAPFAFPAIRAALETSGQNLKVVRTARPLYQSVQSYVARSGSNELEACDFILRHEYAVQRAINDHKLTPVSVAFDDLLSDSAATAASVAAALGITDGAAIAAAAATIDSSLRRFGGGG